MKISLRNDEDGDRLYQRFDLGTKREGVRNTIGVGSLAKK
jgi:hypothetical protein